MDYNALYELCRQRYSCRDYEDVPLTDKQIEQILQLARTAPFVSGRKNWNILVVTDKETISRMAGAVEEEVSRKQGLMDPAYAEEFGRYARYFSLFKKAPALFIPVFRVAPTMRILLGKHFTPDMEAMERDNMTKSVSCVAMLILLAAQSLGLGACYMTGGLLAQDPLREILKLPAGQEIGAIIPAGIPNKQSSS
jgi:nitroreductase